MQGILLDTLTQGELGFCRKLLLGEIGFLTRRLTLDR